MPFIPTLTPAYGRDYKSKKDCLKDFVEGKDFIYHDFIRLTYCSIRDFNQGDEVKLRYFKQTRAFMYKIQQPNPQEDKSSESK